MREKKESAAPALVKEAGAVQPGTAGEEPQATVGQKIFIVALWLYVLSLVWLVLSHNWYGVLPNWLDPH
jgi:hypothetical protein